MKKGSTNGDGAVGGQTRQDLSGGLNRSSKSNADNPNKSRIPYAGVEKQTLSLSPAEDSTDSKAKPLVHQFEPSQSKKTKADTTEIRYLPLQYERCDVNDIVHLVGEMLLDLIRINDKIPLQDEALTRFHSRVPPGISVMDYLHRLATHASLSPPILLSMVYYIDKLCALYPAFTVTSLTVHRYLIASATVASKGLSDTFWTNSTYARVGGVSVKELGLLELELLRRVDWRIVPKPEVLVEYYRSLVDRSNKFQTPVIGDDSGESLTAVTE